MRAQPSTHFELPLGPVFDATVGRFETCAQVSMKESNAVVLSTLNKNGTGSEQVAKSRDHMNDREVPAPLLSGPLSQFRQPSQNER